MSDDSPAPAAVAIDAANAAIGAVHDTIKDLVDRVERLAATQAETLDRIIRLEPVAAAETEVGGDVDAIVGGDPVDHDPPPAADNAAHTAPNPLRRFHQILG